MKILTIFFAVLVFVSCVSKNSTESVSQKSPEFKTTLTKSELQDKIKGGWAGQVIGCTFGGPTEFKFNGTMINDYQPIKWEENSCL